MHRKGEIRILPSSLLCQVFAEKAMDIRMVLWMFQVMFCFKNRVLPPAGQFYLIYRKLYSFSVTQNALLLHCGGVF